MSVDEYLFTFISAVENVRTSIQEHPIDPVCSFDDYVDIDISATSIQQPNTLGDFVEVDLSSSSHNPVYEGLIDGLDEIDAAVHSLNTVPLFSDDKTSTDKKKVELNVKSRKFSLQELKSSENDGACLDKKRNKSLPALTECNRNMEANSHQEEVNTIKSKKEAAMFNDTSEGEFEGQHMKRIKQGETNESKVSSLRSVLIEVDAYENIEIVKKQNKNRAVAKSMNEQQKEQHQVPTRRAISEQNRAPVPQPRTQMKRKTFDPYDYPPGVPIPKEMTENQETEDCEYIPHLPFDDENKQTRRKTFDPYDYPPGVPIPKSLLIEAESGGRHKAENLSENMDKLETGTEYAFIEGSGVYMAYDPDEGEANTVLDKSEECRYINYNTEIFNATTENEIILQISAKEATDNDFHKSTSALCDNLEPPKPCSTPYYVNECVSVFDNDSETHDVNNTKQNTQKGSQENNTESEDNYGIFDTSANIDIYENCLVTNKSREKGRSVGSVTDMNKLEKKKHPFSKSEKNIPAATSGDLRRYRSDDCGIYQNILPEKPPRLQLSEGQLEDNAEPIQVGILANPDAIPNDSLEDDGTDDGDYEAVLVKEKRVQVKMDVEHEYVNVKRFS